MKRVLRSHLIVGLVATVAVLAFGASLATAATAQQQREERRTFAGREGIEVGLENLAGRVTVEGTDGNDIEIVATIHAADGDRADAQTLLGLLDIEFDERGDELRVRVNYPVERFDKYRYPHGGSGSHNTTYQRERVTVTLRNDDDAVTLYVDFVIHVPVGVSADIENNVGDVSASSMRGDFTADTGSGDVTATDITGDVEADTGSGNVEVDRVTGDVTADTGSGDIRFEGDLSGVRQIEIDTSSGDVVLDMSAYPGMTITIETGSGSIDVDLPDLQTQRSRRNYFRGTVGDGSADVVIDTGSGSVRIRGS